MSDRERLIELIYDGVTDEAAWTLALAMIAAAVQSAGVGVGVQDMVTHEFWAVAQNGIDPALHETYERLAPDNLIWQAISRARQPMADQMVMPKAAFLRTELHAAYFVPQGFRSVMAAPVLANGSHCGVLVAFGATRRDDFDQPDLAGLAGFAGHLSRAIGLRLDRARLLADLKARDHVLEDATDGMLLLDARLRVQHLNLAARTVLARQDGLEIQDGRLVCRERRENDDLQQTLRATLSVSGPPAGGWVVVRRGDRAPLLLQATRLPGADMATLAPGTAVVVRVKDPDRDRSPSPALLRRLLGLTPAEARAIAAVARTENEDAAARRVGIATTTLRTQRRNAYQKLGLGDRADLLRLLARYGFS